MPIDHRTAGLVSRFDPQLRRVIRDGQGALGDFVAIGEILGPGEFFLDLAPILQRERPERHVVFNSLFALGNCGVPRLDGAERLTGDNPNIGGLARHLGFLLDLEAITATACKHGSKTRGQNKLDHTHAFLSRPVC